MDRITGLVFVLWSFAADPANLSPKLQEDLAEIRVKIERMERDLARMAPREVELGVSEAQEWIDEFAAEAKLAEEDPTVHGLRQRLVVIEKKRASAKTTPAPEMKPTSTPSNRSKLEELLKVNVDLSKVSFKRDVAPIIADRCLGCHNANRKLGEFDASNYELFAEQIEPGDPANSHVLNLVTGKEQPRMPRGNAGFDTESVAIWTKWIEQGAKFDGPDKKKPITDYLIDADTKRRELIGKLTPSDVVELHRVALAKQLDIVRPQRPVSEFQTPHFLVRTTLSSEDAEYLAVLGEAMLEELLPRYKVESTLWPGGAGLVLFRDRYDYVAFAKGVDNYTPEEHETGHVRLRPELSYLAASAEANGKSLDLVVAEQVASAFFRSLGKGKMPDWGVHGSAVVEAENWDPARAPSVREELKRAAQAMAAPGWKGSLFKGDLPWVEAAPLATSFFAYLKAEQKKLVIPLQKLLADGTPAEQAVTQVLGASEAAIRDAWYSWTIRKYGRE